MDKVSLIIDIYTFRHQPNVANIEVSMLTWTDGNQTGLADFFLNMVERGYK